MSRKPKYKISAPSEPSLPRELSLVSVANPDDFEDLLTFLQRIRNEIDGGTAEWDLLLETTADLVSRNHGIVFVVRGRGNLIEASLALRFYRRLLVRSYLLRIMWNAVLPDKRKTGHAKSLLIQACKFSDEVGCPLWHEEFSPTTDAPRVQLAGRHLLPTGFVFTHLPVATN